MFALGACGAAVLNLSRLAVGRCAPKRRFAAALQLARTVRISLPYADVNAAGSYFLLALFVAWGLAAAGARMRGGGHSPSRRRRGSLDLGVPHGAGRGPRHGDRAHARLSASGPPIPDARRRRDGGRLLFAAVSLSAHRPSIARRDCHQGRAVTRRLSACSPTEPLFGIGVGQFFVRSGEVIRDPAVRALYRAGERAQQLPSGPCGNRSRRDSRVSVAARKRRARDRASPAKRDVPRALPAGAVAGLCAFLATCLAGHPLLLTELSLAFWGVLGATVAAAPPVDAKSMLPSREPGRGGS